MSPITSPVTAKNAHHHRGVPRCIGRMAAPHSITCSAMVGSDAGTSMPKVLRTAAVQAVPLFAIWLNPLLFPLAQAVRDDEERRNQENPE